MALSGKNSFQFNGFRPNKAVKKQSESFYNLIESRSPSDSKKTASLTKKGCLYEARLKLSCAENSCSFEIASQKDRVSDSMESLQRKFLNKILAWNKTRKQNQSILLSQ